MSRLFKILFIVLAIALMAWLLPWLYTLVTASRSKTPFTLYSEIIGDFALFDADGKGKISYTDRRGNKYSEVQFDSILPTFYFRQLATDNRLPDTICGQSVSAQIIKKENFIFRSTPASINARGVPLYPLLESRSKRVDLEMPDDLFRLTKYGIEFIDMETNRVNREKSALFQKVFDRKEVRLPLKHIAGNPTNRKEYDEGYLLVDAADKLFHFKQVQGQPFLRPIDCDSTIKIDLIFVTEYASRRYFAFLTDTKHNFYALTAPHYLLQKVEIPPIDARKNNLTIFGNMFNWTVKQSGTGNDTYTAIDARTLAAIDTMCIPKSEPAAMKAAAYIFPMQLRFTATTDRYFSPRVKDISPLALPLNIICLALFLLLFRKGESLRTLIGKSVAILLFGLFAILPLILLKK